MTVCLTNKLRFRKRRNRSEQWSTDDQVYGCSLWLTNEPNELISKNVLPWKKGLRRPSRKYVSVSVWNILLQNFSHFHLGPIADSGHYHHGGETLLLPRSFLWVKYVSQRRHTMIWITDYLSFLTNMKFSDWNKSWTRFRSFGGAQVLSAGRTLKFL